MGTQSSFQVIPGDSATDHLPNVGVTDEICFLAACPSIAKLWLHILVLVWQHPTSKWEFLIRDNTCFSNDPLTAKFPGFNMIEVYFLLL